MNILYSPTMWDYRQHISQWELGSNLFGIRDSRLLSLNRFGNRGRLENIECRCWWVGVDKICCIGDTLWNQNSADILKSETDNCNKQKHSDNTQQHSPYTPPHSYTIDSQPLNPNKADTHSYCLKYTNRYILNNMSYWNMLSNRSNMINMCQY